MYVAGVVSHIKVETCKLSTITQIICTFIQNNSLLSLFQIRSKKSLQFIKRNNIYFVV